MPNKKIQIPRISLDSTTPDGKYQIRYRVLSENKLSTTEWSDYITLIPSKTVLDITGSITPTYSYTSPNLTVSWQIPTNKPPYIKSYDVYFQWYIGSVWQNWKFYKTINATNDLYSLTVPKDASATRGRAAVFASTYPRLSSTEIDNSGTSGKNGYMNKVFVTTTYTSTP